MSGSGKHFGMMVVPGYGSVPLHVAAVSFGISIVSTESVSKFNKAIYVAAKTAGSFGLDLNFYSQASYHLMGRILLHYGNNLARGVVGSPIRVMIPSVKDGGKGGKTFDRVGIPAKAPIPFGDDVSAVNRRMSLEFIGTSDPYSPVGVKDVTLVSNVVGSEYASAIKKDPQAAYYYPVGTQLSGNAYGVDTLYDTTDVPFAEAEEAGQSAADREGWVQLPNGKWIPE